MDVNAFLERVDSIFDGDPLDGGRPKDQVFERIVEQVAGYTTAHELAVLNLAARQLPPDEVYLEVGTYKGRSICGAVQGVTDRTFVLSENYLEFGMLGRDARAELHDNLRRHAQHVDIQFLEGDCFSTLVRPGAIRRPVGVYFYDGKHTRLSHYLALGVVEPLLADEALVLVDDATWPVVQAAHTDYLHDHPGWTVVRRWDARHNGDPAWANGLHALRWQRPADRTAGLDGKVRSRRLAQVGVVGPVESLAWHALHRFPALVPVASRLYPKRSSAIR